MREILFRGKREDNGEWVYGSFIPDLLEVFATADEQKEMTNWGFIKPFARVKEERYMQYVDRSTVGQYIGQLDKNEKKIFDGDIVKVCLDPEIKIGVVELDWRIAGFIVKFPEGKCVTFLDIFQAKAHVQDKVWVEVIGNIHDNPELMKGETENA